MAESVQIPGTAEQAKICNLVGVGALSFVPFYTWIFWYRINKEMALYGQAKGTDECGTSPGKSLLAVSLGALIIVPAILSFINTHKRIVASQKLAGVEPLNGWISVLAYFIFSPAWIAYMQSGLNAVWQAGGTAAPAAQIAESTPAPAVDTAAADAPAEGEQA